MKAPDVFELSDIDGHATARFSEVPKTLEAAVREAEATCPERAIILSDD
jgi:ferredoxin